MTEQSTSEAQTEQTVVVSRSVGRPVKDVWGVLVTPKGAEALLGEGGTIGDKGHAWRAADRVPERRGPLRQACHLAPPLV